MIDDQKIHELILALAKAKGWKSTYASKMATGSGDMMARLAAGSGVTLRRANAIVERVSALWPDGQEWPSDIPRPQKKQEGAA